MIDPSPEISSRNDFPALLVKRGLTGLAVEVGTHRGLYAEQILKNWPGVLYCVDPYRDNLENYDDPIEGERAGHFAEARVRLDRFFPRIVFVVDLSPHASMLFENDSLDFVYIDANHHYISVTGDIAFWLPKVKPGGILAGHDYDPGHPGVCQAVNEFAESHKVWRTQDQGDPPSWYCVKEE